MPFPSGDIGWNPASGDRVEPSTFRKTLGWLIGEKPPAPFFNWFWYMVSLLWTYTKNIPGEDFTWTGAHTFQRLIDTAVNAALPRLTFTSFTGTNLATDKTAPITFDTGTKKVRIYIDRAGDLEIVAQAYWDATAQKWTKDSTGTGSLAYILRIGNGGIAIGAQPGSGDTPWGNLIGAAGNWTTNVAGADQALGLVAAILRTSTITSSLAAIAVKSALAFSGVQGTFGRADKARVSLGRDIQYSKRTTEFTFPGLVIPIEMYRSLDTIGTLGALEVWELGINTQWNATDDMTTLDNWSSIDHTVGSFLIQLYNGGIRFLSRSATASTWTDSGGTGGWNRGHPVMVLDPDGVSTGFRNVISKLTVAKAHAHITSLGTGLAPTVGADAYGINAVLWSSDTSIQITLATPMKDTGYTVMATVNQWIAQGGCTAGGTLGSFLLESRVDDESHITIFMRDDANFLSQGYLHGAHTLNQISFSVTVYGDQDVA